MSEEQPDVTRPPLLGLWFNAVSLAYVAMLWFTITVTTRFPGELFAVCAVVAAATAWAVCGARLEGWRTGPGTMTAIGIAVMPALLTLVLVWLLLYDQIGPGGFMRWVVALLATPTLLLSSLSGRGLLMSVAGILAAVAIHAWALPLPF